MAKIFGMIGEKQSGKNSLCNFFKEMLPDYSVVEFAFARALKDLAMDIFQIPFKSVYGTDADKNYPISTWGKYFSTIIQNKYGKANDTLLSGREFLQILGTDIIREKNNAGLSDGWMQCLNMWMGSKLGSLTTNPNYDFKNLWTDILVSDVNDASPNFDIITISDVRFLNEVNVIKKMGGKIIRLHRDSGSKNSIPHQSELEMKDMDDSLFDYILEAKNNKNLEQLKLFAIRILMGESLIGIPG